MHLIPIETDRGSVLEDKAESGLGTCSGARPHQLPGDDGDGDQAQHDEEQEDGEPVKPQQVSAVQVLPASPPHSSSCLRLIHGAAAEKSCACGKHRVVGVHVFVAQDDVVGLRIVVALQDPHTYCTTSHA